MLTRPKREKNAAEDLRGEGATLPAAPAPKPLLDPTQLGLAPISDHEEYRIALEHLRSIDARLNEAKTRENRARTRLNAVGLTSPRSITARASDLLAGGVVSSSSPKEELRASELEQAILVRAKQEATEALDEIKGRLSFEAGERFKQLNREVMRRLYEDIKQLWRTVDTAIAIRAELTNKGYFNNYDNMKSYIPRSIQMLSKPEDHHGEAYQFRLWLLQQGILTEADL